MHVKFNVWKHKSINVRDVSFSIKRLKMSSCKKNKQTNKQTNKTKKKKNRLTDTHDRTLQQQQHNKILFVYTVCMNI